MSALDFVHETRPARVVFGAGARRHLPRELDALGLGRALVLTTPGHAALGHEVAALLGARSVGVHAGAVMHVPVEAARVAADTARRLGADVCVAAGGGSTIGLAKAIALESGLPSVALPTTYAGSEMTPLYGLTEGGQKKTGRDWRVMPRVVVYDPELSRDLPVAVSMASGMNAVAHAAEGLYAQDASPLHRVTAQEGIRAIARALPRLHAAPNDAVARSDALYGAWLCGSVLGQVQMGLHHKICHTLGGAFNLPHAELHTVMLPHTLAYNASAAPQAMAALGQALGLADAPGLAAPRALQGLNARLSLPATLRDIGLPAQALDRAAELAASAPYPNPRPIERAALRELLQRAFEGADVA